MDPQVPSECRRRKRRSGAKHARNRRNRLIRRLLESTSPEPRQNFPATDPPQDKLAAPSTSSAEDSRGIDVEFNLEQNITSNDTTPFSRGSPSPQRVPSPSPPYFLLSPSYSPVYPDPPSNKPPGSPDSTRTERRLPYSPPPTPRSPSPSPEVDRREVYSPVSSVEDIQPSSPASFTSSVEFVEEIPFVAPPPKHYFYGVHDDFHSLISQFPIYENPLPPHSFTLGPDGFDLEELRTIISGFPSNSVIPVYLPGSTHPHLVPIKLFYNVFPQNTAQIEELPPSPEPCE